MRGPARVYLGKGRLVRRYGHPTVQELRTRYYCIGMVPKYVLVLT